MKNSRENIPRTKHMRLLLMGLFFYYPLLVKTLADLKINVLDRN